MALKPTIYKLHLDISDLNRGYYDSLNLTIALHPSEKVERMMARIVAYALNARESLSLTKGLSVVEEPDIWVKTLDDQIKLWIDIGEPSADRVKKSSRQALEVKVYSFNSKSNTWWEQGKRQFQTFKNVRFYQLDWQGIQELGKMTKRNMDWSMTVSDKTVYIATENQSCELEVSELV